MLQSKLPYLWAKFDMKALTLILGLSLLILVGCKEGKVEKASMDATDPPAKSLLEQLADKHGFENWKDVNTIRFTFNVDRDTIHSERSWIWDVRENRVTQISASDTISYLRSEIDSLVVRTDGAFINDKYWLLAPYQWVWDQNSFTYDYQQSATAPISGEPMAKLTIVYGEEGGYTPGDAYDFYLDQDSVVREWVFRRGNQPEPSVTTTWEGYQTNNGLLLSTSHLNAERTYEISFTGISVE